MKKPKILVTGASGYIGGRLVDDLLTLNHNVISMVRRPEQFKNQFSKPHTIRYGNTLDKISLNDKYINIYHLNKNRLDCNIDNLSLLQS